MKKGFLFLLFAIVSTVAQAQDLIKIGADKFLHVTGVWNTSLGQYAGNSISTGNSNTFIGITSGNQNTTGTGNTYLGAVAGRLNVVGNENVSIGLASGYNNTASNNTFMGAYSGNRNTSGNTNTYIGSLSGYNNLTGSNNVFLGANADGYGADSSRLQRAVAIGYNAKVSINDAIVLGDTENSAIKVGIGVHNPQYKLDVKGVVNMRIALNSPALKLNGNEFLATDSNGDFILSSFKFRYKTEAEWSDKVFEENYPLMPFDKVITFVKENKHLPNIPGVKEVIHNGIDVKEQLSKQLEKIEELYLYLNELKEENKALRKEINELKNNRK
ncbi:hypothetical protein [Emticicia agri]|uniref:TMF family protein n=1 Tax=Emticicia agri TaxID=2492393 RepID=A0A4Q5M589_9BACT|nr:hypothetical protein [Emticicia agri]RYU97027.1 hypothetical protein EWM59_03705 [Emticicia agri]